MIPQRQAWAGQVFGAGALMLGALGLLHQDFALQWQPAAPEMPGRAALALSLATVEVLAGLAFVLRQATPAAGLALALAFTWVAAGLHLPRVLASPETTYLWLGFCETLGAAAAAALAAQDLVKSHRHRGQIRRLLVTVFGVCLLVFGASHFVYADVTAQLIPAWLGAPVAWTYLTGAGHALAGIGLISGVLARWASLCVAGMFACFVLLLHVPQVVAEPRSRLEWTMLGMALLLLGSAALAAESIWRERRGLDRGAAQDGTR